MTLTATRQKTPTVRLATSEDVPELATALAQSYASCPGWHWYMPTDTKERQPRMERFFRAVLRRYLTDGRECWTTGDRDGAALWDPPERWRMGNGESLRMLVAMVPTFRRTLVRTVRGFSALDAVHPHEPHYYLSALGVSPGRNGREIAAALIAPGLDRCERERLPCYAETARPASREFFARNGFEVVAEIELPGGGPTAWGMWRKSTA